MAIDDILDEHEQSERVLEWLRRNGAGLIGGILLGLAAIGGWKWWQQRQQQQELAAASQYQAALDAIQDSDEQAQTKVKALGDSAYGTLAALELADSQVAAGQRDAAIATLRAAHPNDPAITAIVNQRLARLLIDAEQAEAALKLIDGATTPSELEIRGDAQYVLGQRDKAREAYAQALTKLDIASPQRRLLELKLTEVGGSPANTEAQL
jgi:predicted negative regulator of RcsB-dependent stress response